VKKNKSILASAWNAFKQVKWPVKILLLVVIVSFFATGAIVVTGQPGFCNSCHIMNDYYDSWKTSEHSNVNCLDCHLQPGFTGYIKGKINGLAQAVDCIVGRVSTKPSATVTDTSCLRPECHSSEKLASTDIDFAGIKFTHNNHLDKDVKGIKISCGTCHSHFEGNEHFSVNTNACFTCHFLKINEADTGVVQTGCTDCHEVPNKVIKRGLVTINHAEFVSYKASCEESCHKQEIHKISQVDNNVCLNCHTFSKEQNPDILVLHEAHTHYEKVECFACHGQVLHGKKEVTSISVMMDCRNCHSDTHQAQRTIYATQHPMETKETDRILSPMFLTHVECTGCHIEKVAEKSGALNSFGTVAKAVPRACDNCHEKGTGQQYIPFWQNKIKTMHEETSRKLDRLKSRRTTTKLKESIDQAQSILDSISSDGSWGVHNFKYTEALLNRADEIVSGARQ
jgi:nitrate/TMAO reductase-like tetraheme cytochrome c subunit